MLQTPVEHVFDQRDTMVRPSLLRCLALEFFATLCLLLIVGRYLWPCQPLNLFRDAKSPPSSSHHNHHNPHINNHLDFPNLHVQGQGACFPPSTTQTHLNSLVSSIRATCRDFSPFHLPRKGQRHRRIGTLTAQWGNPQDYYQKATEAQLVHALVHDDDLHVLCGPVIEAPKNAPDTLYNRLEIYWNKPALILSVLLSEMAKPRDERLEWVLWADADVLILDHCRPIASFLPPEDSQYHDDDEDDEHAPHLLYTKDFLGLNNGVFLLRVNSWSINFFSAVLGFRNLRPTVTLDYLDQTVMEILVDNPRFRDHVLQVPQRWFNTYSDPAGDADDFAERDDEAWPEDYHARRGDFLVHFAGDPHRSVNMNAWVDMKDELENVWETGRVQRDVSSEVERFWAQWAAKKKKKKK